MAILPTAPARQVQQRYGRDDGQAKRELVASQPLAFPYKSPWTRADERQAQSLELRADVPPFDPSNPRHLRAWEAIWDFGKRSWQSDME
ncbi:MAG: hypothetical protein WBL74_06340 [Novosphingobium sp.]|uniref:hypothetical protein n=1 Tax=Novosphingobium sp. TaxID=1874826 RepID=UPI003C7CE8B0